MMNWIKSLDLIIEANNNNRLVIFVGSGISKNSTIPTWHSLIESIAKEIG